MDNIGPVSGNFRLVDVLVAGPGFEHAPAFMPGNKITL